MLINLAPRYGVNYTAGQLFFTKNDRSIVSNGIAYFTGREVKKEVADYKVSHVGICIGENLGVEMQFTGFAKCDLGAYFSDLNTRIVFREPKLLNELGTSLLMNHIEKWLAEGIDYDFGLIVGMIISKSKLGRFMPEFVRQAVLKTFGSDKKRICSEAVQILCNRAGYHHEEVHRIDPQELFNAEWLKPLNSDLSEKNEGLIIHGREKIFPRCPKCLGKGVSLDMQNHCSVVCSLCEGHKIIRRRFK